MKTINSKLNWLEVILQRALLLSLSLSLISCSDNDPPENQLSESGEIIGSVKDENGNPYPSTLVTLTKNTEKNTRATTTEGLFNLTTKDIGSYIVEMEPPLSTIVTSANPVQINVKSDIQTSVDFIIQPQPAKAHLNFGDVQLLEEIVGENGNTPSSPGELLFAKNIFDAPLGQLNPIMAPDGHQITLSEFKQANGELLVHCNGNSSTVEISLEGMIPNGTYTFWLAYLKRKVSVSQPIDFANDFVNFTNPPIGPSNGSGNVVVADANGKIQTTLVHSSCILTNEVALVIPVLYHLNGKTFGGGHQPDAEEMVQMLVYFQ